MRKTKCKSCNGGWVPGVLENSKCPAKCDHGEISVYTIQELRDGKVAVINDGSICDLMAVLKMAFPSDVVPPDGSYKFYWASDNNLTWWSGYKTDLPTQYVKIFIEEIEQEDKEVCTNTFYCSPAKTKNDDGTCANCGLPKPDKVEQFGKTEQLEPEFKWGEEVEVEGHNWVKAIYYCPDPLATGRHLVNVGGTYNSYLRIRKPEKITLTLSQIAEKFNCKPAQIKIVE